jgi:hypothetical protein
MDRVLKGLKPDATVAADGRFSIEDLARGAPVHVVVRAHGYLIAQVRAVRPPTEKPVVIRLQPAADLVGRVVDEAGALSTLPPGTWTLLVGAEGGAVVTASLPVPSEEPVAVTLPPAGRLNVRVPALLASDLIGTVRLLGRDQQPFWTLGPGGTVVQQWPLAGGKAVVEGVPAGSWTVQVETPDGQRWQGAAVTGGAAVATVTIE